MSLKEDLEKDVKFIITDDSWTFREGKVVPDPKDLRLGNEGVKLNATILYADMASSTALVKGHKATFAAEVYKSFLSCAAKIIKSQSGVITAYDGDRVMAVYLGDAKNTNAVRTALKIRSAVSDIIQPAINREYTTTYKLEHSIGVDTSEILVSRIGVRNDNDLVWIGRAANYAAKLSDLNKGYTYITKAVFDLMAREVKYGGSPEQLMWEARTWTAMDGLSIYRSGWKWSV
jgi:class 3 adenylate cyclase